MAAAIFLLFSGYRLTQMWLVPEVSIAIARDQPEYISLFSALAEVADAENLKLHVRAFDNAAAVARALEAAKVDFAVVRANEELPRNGLTAALLRSDPILIFRFDKERTDAKGKTGKQDETPTLEQLTGIRIGIIASLGADRRTISRMLEATSGNGATNLTLEGNPERIRTAIARKEVDAIAIAAPSNSIRLLLTALADLQPVLILTNVATVTAEMPLLDQAKIVANSLTNELPKEEIQAPAISWRLVAGKDVERATVSSFLQALFSSRIALSQSSDLAWSIMGLPDEDATYAKFPNHRGALDYYNREQQTFMDLYGDWLWLGLFAAGGVSSGLAWLFQVLSRRRKQLVESVLDRLLEILNEAREADTVQKLDNLTLEIDGLVTHAIRQARWRATDATLTTALTLAIDSSRAAVADRRALLSGSKSELVAPGETRSPRREFLPVEKRPSRLEPITKPKNG